MLWVAFAMLVMYATGGGDDTRAFRKLASAMSSDITKVVEDPGRQEVALSALDDMRVAFAQSRERLGAIGDCVEQVDRTYEATAEDYFACDPNRAGRWSEAEQHYTRFKTTFRASFTDAEWSELGRRLRRKLTRAQR